MADAVLFWNGMPLRLHDNGDGTYSLAVQEETTGADADEIQGNIAHDSADAGKPIKIGGKAESTVPSAVADADRVDAWFDLLGRLVTSLKDTSGNEIFGEVTDSPAVNTLLARLKTLATLLNGGLPTALGTGGGVKVDGSGTALPVSAASLPLPAGAATEATLALVESAVDGIEALLAGGLPAALGVAGGLKADVMALPAGNLGQQLKAASLSIAPATDITDATYIGDIKFGESLPYGTALLGNTGVDQTTPGTTNKVSIGNPQTPFNATGAGAIALSTAMAKAFRLVSLNVHYSSAPTTSENLTLTKNALAGTAYDTVLFTANPAVLGATDLVYLPDKEITFLNGDELDLASANTDARTYGATILCEAV